MKKALLRGPKGQCRRSVQVERQRKAGLVEMAMSAVISLEGFVQAPDRHDATRPMHPWSHGVSWVSWSLAELCTPYGNDTTHTYHARIIPRSATTIKFPRTTVIFYFYFYFLCILFWNSHVHSHQPRNCFSSSSKTFHAFCTSNDLSSPKAPCISTSKVLGQAACPKTPLFLASTILDRALTLLSR